MVICIIGVVFVLVIGQHVLFRCISIFFIGNLYYFWIIGVELILEYDMVVLVVFGIFVLFLVYYYVCISIGYYCVIFMYYYYGCIFHDYMIVWSGVCIVSSSSLVCIIMYFIVLVIMGSEWIVYNVIEINLMVDLVYLSGLIVLFMVGGWGWWILGYGV